jgi:hypothetical protein
VEMLYSLFHAFQYDGNEPLQSFEAALNAQEDRRAGRRIGRQTYFAQGLVYHQAARFAEQLQRYFDVFGRERVQVVLHEDLASDPAAVYRELLEFLEVDPAHKLTEFPRVNPSKTVRSRTLRAVLNDSAVRWALLAIQPALSGRVFNAFHRIERTLTRCNSCSQERPPLDPELRSRLQHDFAPQVERLSDLIGRDLTQWSREVVPAQRPVARRGVVRF